MPTILIMDGDDNEIMTITYEKDATVMEAMDALVNLKKREFNTPGTGFRESGA